MTLVEGANLKWAVLKYTWATAKNIDLVVLVVNQQGSKCQCHNITIVLQLYKDSFSDRQQSSLTKCNVLAGMECMRIIITTQIANTGRGMEVFLLLTRYMFCCFVRALHCL